MKVDLELLRSTLVLANKLYERVYIVRQYGTELTVHRGNCKKAGCDIVMSIGPTGKLKIKES